MVHAVMLTNGSKYIPVHSKLANFSAARESFVYKTGADEFH
jgi:hypothetical protein